jgi:enoyl-CoA hydratase/carnithine racemase
LPLTGAGESICAGIDLAKMAESKRRVPPADLLPIPDRNIEISKPIIAAVRGFAYAGGWRRCATFCGEGASFAMMKALVEAERRRWRIRSDRASCLSCCSRQSQFPDDVLTRFVNHTVPDSQVMSGALKLAEPIIACAPLFAPAAEK